MSANGGSCVSLSSANNLLANLYRFHTTCPLPLEDSGEGIWLCSSRVLTKKIKFLYYSSYSCSPPMTSYRSSKISAVPCLVVTKINNNNLFNLLIIGIYGIPRGQVIQTYFSPVLQYNSRKKLHSVIS